MHQSDFNLHGEKRSRLTSGTSNAIYSWWSPISVEFVTAAFSANSKTNQFSRAQGFFAQFVRYLLVGRSWLLNSSQGAKNWDKWSNHFLQFLMPFARNQFIDQCLSSSKATGEPAWPLGAYLGSLILRICTKLRRIMRFYRPVWEH